MNTGAIRARDLAVLQNQRTRRPAGLWGLDLRYAVLLSCQRFETRDFDCLPLESVLASTRHPCPSQPLKTAKSTPGPPASGGREPKRPPEAPSQDDSGRHHLATARITRSNPRIATAALNHLLRHPRKDSPQEDEPPVRSVSRE